MAEIDRKRIEALLAAAKKMHGPAPGLTLPGRAERLTDGHAVAALLTPVLERAGLDLGALEKILTQERPHSPRKPDGPTIQRHAARQAAVVRNMQALARLPRPPRAPFDPPVVEIIQPLFTWSWPTGVMVSSSLAPGDNRIQARLDTTQDVLGQYVSFVYVWNNPNDYDVAVDVDTSMGFLGFCSVKTSGGILPDVQFSSAHVSTLMAIYQGGTPDVLTTPVVHVVDLVTNSYWGSSFNAAPVDTIVDVSNTTLYVSRGETVAFEVFAGFVSTNVSGHAVFDFAEPDFRISTPGMMVTSSPYIIE